MFFIDAFAHDIIMKVDIVFLSFRIQWMLVNIQTVGGPRLHFMCAFFAKWFLSEPFTSVLCGLWVHIPPWTGALHVDWVFSPYLIAWVFPTWGV